MKLNFKHAKLVWIIVGALIALAAGAGVYRLRAGKKESAAWNRAQVRRGDLEIVTVATGTVQPENRLEIKAPIAGRVEKVLVVEGQRVSKGQNLAWMSSAERAALLDAARAEGANEVAKWEGLYKPTPVLAPIAGTIILRSVEAGQSFTATDAILVMSDRLTVKAQVDETDLAKVKLGQEARVTMDAYPDSPVPAKVSHIAFEAKTVNNVTNYEIEVLPAKIPDYMRSGMSANVQFVQRAERNALLLPSEAIENQGASDNAGSAQTWVPDANGKPIARAVRVGMSDGKFTQVTDGIAEGDTVMWKSVKLYGTKASATSPFGMPRAPGGRKGSGGGGPPN